MARQASEIGVESGKKRHARVVCVVAGGPEVFSRKQVRQYRICINLCSTASVY
jgi:hypothetical protein